MKKVKFLRYLNHPELTGGVQYVPDEIAEFSNKVAEVLVGSNHAEYVPEPKVRRGRRSMDDYELADYDEVVP